MKGVVVKIGIKDPWQVIPFKEIKEGNIFKYQIREPGRRPHSECFVALEDPHKDAMGEWKLKVKSVRA